MWRVERQHVIGLKSKSRCQLICHDGLVMGHENGTLSCRGTVKIESQTQHSGAVTCITQCCDLLISGSADRTIKCWKIDSTKGTLDCVASISAHDGTVSSVALGGTDEAPMLISCSTDNTCKFWKSTSSSAVKNSYGFRLAGSVRGKHWYCALAVGNLRSDIKQKPVYIGDANGFLTVVDSERQEKLSSFRLHDLGISQLQFLEQQNLLVSCSNDTTVRVCDMVSQVVILTIENPRSAKYSCVHWDRLSHLLHVGDTLGNFEVWNVYTTTKYLSQNMCEDTGGDEPRGSEKTIQSCVVGHDTSGNSTIYVVIDSFLQMWSLECLPGTLSFKGHKDRVISISSSLETSSVIGSSKILEDTQFKLFSCSEDNTIRSWDTYDMRCESLLEVDRSEVSCMIKVPNCSVVVSGYQDGSIRWWNYETSVTGVEKLHTNTVSSLCLAKTTKNMYLISGSYDGTIVIWAMSRKDRFRMYKEAIIQVYGAAEKPAAASSIAALSLTGGNVEVMCVAFNPKKSEIGSTGILSETVITGGSDGSIRIWRFDRYKQLGELWEHTEAVTCLVAHESYLISGSDDKTVRIWNIENVDDGFPLVVIDEFENPLCDIAVIASEAWNRFFLCAVDGALKVWHFEIEEPKDGQHEELAKTLILQHELHNTAFTCMAFSPSSSRVILGTDIGDILSVQLESSQ